MDMCRIYLFLCANLVAAAVAYYRKCYEDLSLCLITNTDDTRDVWSSQFKLAQSSAANWCSNHSSTLASITNKTVQSAIKDFINDSSAKLDLLVFTSGYRVNLHSWKWINGNSHSIAAFGDYAYLVASPHRKYLNFYGEAIQKRLFICSYHNISCRKDYQRMGRTCYKIHNKNVTWFEARNICLNERSDLATFEDGNFSLAFDLRSAVQYWVGLRKERWLWTPEQDIIYSNWENFYPHPTGGNCLCLRATTGKWESCDCTSKSRYICIQGYSSNSTIAAKTPTSQRTTTTITTKATFVIPSTTITTSTQPTTKTTTMPTSTTKTTPSRTKTTPPTIKTTPPTTKTTPSTTKTTPSTTKTTPSTTTSRTTPSTTTVTPTVRDPSSHSTSTQALDDNLMNKTSADQPVPFQSGEKSGILPALGIGIACLVILIIVIVVVTVKRHRRSRSGDVGPKPRDSPSQTTPDADAQNSVYATVVPNTSEPTQPASDKIQNQIVYAELDLVTRKRNTTTLKASKAVVSTLEKTPNETVYAEVSLVAPKAEITQRNSKAVGSSVEKNQNQIVYAELDLVPKQGNKRGRAGPESEYPNGIPLESVYANSTPN